MFCSAYMQLGVFLRAARVQHDRVRFRRHLDKLLLSDATLGAQTSDVGGANEKGVIINQPVWDGVRFGASARRAKRNQTAKQGNQFRFHDRILAQSAMTVVKDA